MTIIRSANVDASRTRCAEKKRGNVTSICLPLDVAWTVPRAISGVAACDREYSAIEKRTRSVITG